MKCVSVVGIGPGNELYLSIAAKETLEESDLIVGYKKYVELVEEYLPEKEYLYTGMTKEVDRCKMALEKAAEGNAVSVVCSGDAGVYGMAGLVYELSVDYPDVEIDIDTQTVTVKGKTLHLTGKEYGIMELLSLRKGATLNKDQFLNHLYGGIDEPELKIIDVFICKLRKKLENASGGKNYIETVWGRGYVLRDPDDPKSY